VLKSTVLKAVATAKSALQDLAVEASIVDRTALPYVPGQAVQYTEVLTSTSIVFTSFEFNEIDGDRVLGSDIKGLVFPGNTVPQPNDLIKVKETGLKYRILASKNVMVGTTIALSELHIRAFK
jgi:hypothetical protein